MLLPKKPAPIKVQAEVGLRFKCVPLVHPCGPRIVEILEDFRRDVIGMAEVIDGGRRLVTDDGIGGDAVPVPCKGQCAFFGGGRPLNGESHGWVVDTVFTVGGRH